LIKYGKCIIYIIKNSKIIFISTKKILSHLEKHLILGSQITKEVKEMRFSKGKVCLHCRWEDILMNGKYNNKQIYICKKCGKTFTDFTNSATYKSKKSLDKLLIYSKCMLNEYSIRKSAEIVEINVVTSFFWKHKILNCISEFLGVDSVDGVVEAYEVFFAYSYKGIKPINMPRSSLKRGKHKEDIYHIQYINSLHSDLKRWMSRLMVLQQNILIIISNSINE